MEEEAEKAIEVIEWLIDRYTEKLEFTKLPQDEKEEIRLWAAIYRMRGTVVELQKLTANDSMG